MPAGAVHAFQVWKEAGNHTGLIGKNHCFEQQKDLDLFDTWCEIGLWGLQKGAWTKGMDWFRPIESIDIAHAVRRNMPRVSPRFSCATSDFPMEDCSAGLVAGQIVRFLGAHREEPFALWVSFPDPHTPYEAPERYAEMFPAEKMDLPPWREGEFDESAPERNRVLYEMIGMEEDSLEEIYGVMGAYYGMVRFLDDGLGQILDALERTGLREKTIVMFCSDHGDFVGEHRMVAKGGVFYDCMTRVPLIVSYPGQVPEGETDESMVNLIDVAPTLLRLQGLEAPRSMQGEELPRVTDAEPRDGGVFGVRGGRAAISDFRPGGASQTVWPARDVALPCSGERRRAPEDGSDAGVEVCTRSDGG